jgi:hypothetical protein
MIAPVTSLTRIRSFYATLPRRRTAHCWLPLYFVILMELFTDKHDGWIQSQAARATENL